MTNRQASRTARKVALNILALGSRRGMEHILPPGIAESTAELLVASGVAGPGTIRFARTRMAVAIYLAFDWMMPGQFEAFAHRKAFCERQVRKGIEARARQVLVLGAGYDTLGWRLAPEFEEVGFFEIDQPATARLKSKGIEAMGPRPNLHLLSQDLGERSLIEVLGSNEAWDMTAPSVIVAEGLLMYLAPEAVESLLRRCAAVCGTGSRLAFSYVGRLPDGRPDGGPRTGMLLEILRRSGEPWLWGIQPSELGRFLEEHAWNIDPRQTIGSTRKGIEYFGVAVR